MRKHVEESGATGVAAGRGRGGRFSAGRKREVVMRLLRGEDLESVSRAVGITAARGVALAGSVSGCGAGGPKEPRTGCSGRRPSSAAGQDRRAADGDRVTVREGGPAGGRRPFGPAEVDAMSGAQSISTRRAYGVQRVCRVWHRARSSVYARRQATRSPARCRRRGPIGAAPDDVLVAHIRRVLEASPFHGEGYRKAWAKLRVAGMRTSKERVRRLMREHDLQAPPRAGHAHGPKAHDGTITTEAPDVMWGTDMTATVTRGRPSSSWPSITARPHASGSMPPSAGTASRPWSRSARASANASGASAKAWPVGCVCATTTARTTWPTIFNRRSRSSASKAPRASCESPKATASRSASSAR